MKFVSYLFTYIIET